MAGSLGGRARRVRRLEARRVPERPPATSRTQEEARALDAEIRALEREVKARGDDPDDRGRAELDTYADLPLEEQIAAIEKEIDLWQ